MSRYAERNGRTNGRDFDRWNRGYERRGYRGDFDWDYDRGYERDYDERRYGRDLDRGYREARDFGPGPGYRRGEYEDYGRDYERAGPERGYRPDYDRGRDRDRASWDYDRGGRGRYTEGPRRAGYGANWMVPGPHSGVGPKGYQRSEARIIEDVSERLTNHGQIDASDIEVTVEGDVVTLKGTVDSRAVKRMAEDVAESAPGVRDVRNELRLKESGGGSSGKESSRGKRSKPS